MRRYLLAFLLFLCAAATAQTPPAGGQGSEAERKRVAAKFESIISDMTVESVTASPDIKGAYRLVYKKKDSPSAETSFVTVRADVMYAADFNPLETPRANPDSLGRVIEFHAGGARVVTSQTAPWTAFHEVVYDDGRVIYIEKQRLQALQGDLYRLQPKFENLTGRLQERARAQWLRRMPLDDAVVIRNGDGGRVLTGFCWIWDGYCKKLMGEIRQLPDTTVVIFPVPDAMAMSDLAEARERVAGVLCHPNRTEYWLNVMARGSTAVRSTDANCLAAAQRNQETFKRLGASGSPALYLANGKAIPGYRPVAELSAALPPKGVLTLPEPAPRIAATTPTAPAVATMQRSSAHQCINQTNPGRLDMISGGMAMNCVGRVAFLEHEGRYTRSELETFASGVLGTGTGPGGSLRCLPPGLVDVECAGQGRFPALSREQTRRFACIGPNTPDVVNAIGQYHNIVRCHQAAGWPTARREVVAAAPAPVPARGAKGGGTGAPQTTDGASDQPATAAASDTKATRDNVADYEPGTKAIACLVTSKRSGGFNIADHSLKNICPTQVKVLTACVPTKVIENYPYPGLMGLASSSLTTLSPDEDEPAPDLDVCAGAGRGLAVHAVCSAGDPYFTSRTGASFECRDYWAKYQAGR